ncbi:MAG: AMP-binding protein [Betaproteobacteria bacterium]|nr:AMP-binding protein [Betaproteobacteria bacterium]
MSEAPAWLAEETPPPQRTLAQVLRVQAVARAEGDALVAGGKRLSYRKLEEQSGCMARSMLALGVKRGEHIGILMGNTLEWVLLFFAAARIGAVTVPLNTRFKSSELAYCLKQAEVRHLFHATRFLNIDFGAMLDEIPEQPAVSIATGSTRWAEFLHRGNAVPVVRLREAEALVKPDDVLLIQYTSGTTSFPKGAQLSHHGMLGNAWCAARRIGVRAEDRYYSPRPFYHVGGSTLSLLVALSAGACLLTTPAFEAGEALALMAGERATLMSGNDTIFQMLLAHPDFDAAKLCLRGGWAAAGPEVLDRIRSRMGMEGVCLAYGLSEASPNVVMSSWQEPFEARRSGAAFPHPGMDVSIAGGGEILVRGWSVMKGYWNMPEETANAIDADGWLHTGDLGSLDDSGRLRFAGRLKEMLRVGGENVSPLEVEELLHTHPSIAFAQVIGVPDARLGEVPCAYVMLRPGAALAPQELIEWCRPRCANFKAPRYVKVVVEFESLGMTGSSKVQKGRLREDALREFELG